MCIVRFTTRAWKTVSRSTACRLTKNNAVPHVHITWSTDIIAQYVVVVLTLTRIIRVTWPPDNMKRRNDVRRLDCEPLSTKMSPSRRELQYARTTYIYYNNRLVVVVLTLTRIISPWLQDRLQSLWSWGISREKTQTKGGTRIYSVYIITDAIHASARNV